MRKLVRLSLRESSPRSFRTKSLARGLSLTASRRRARKEALRSGDEAIVLGAPELPEALAEDRQETHHGAPVLSRQ